MRYGGLETRWSRKGLVGSNPTPPLLSWMSDSSRPGEAGLPARLQRPRVFEGLRPRGLQRAGVGDRPVPVGPDPGVVGVRARGAVEHFLGPAVSQLALARDEPEHGLELRLRTGAGRERAGDGWRRRDGAAPG